MSEQKWIVDRRPTAKDGLFVWVDLDGKVEPLTWVSASWQSTPWCRMSELPPKPYKPPIDISLAASNERVEKASKHGMSCPELANEPQVCGMCDRMRVIEAAKKWSAKQATKEFANQPLPLDLDAPDPGEGWELCSAREAEQNWNDVAGKWMYGKDYGGFNRRRVVMTTPPDKTHYEKDVWYLAGGWWYMGDANRVRRLFNTTVTAWCHRLDGETKPPQFATEWSNNR